MGFPFFTLSISLDTRSHEDSEQEHAIQSIQDDMSIDDELENTGLGTPVNNHHPAQRSK